MTLPSFLAYPVSMQAGNTDEMAELLDLQRRQALRLDQIRVMLGVLLGITVVTTLFFLAALTR